MADIWTGQVGNAWCPQMHIGYWIASQNDTSANIEWYIDYVAHNTAAYTNGIARTFNINIDGQARSGSLNINGITNTRRVASGTVSVGKTHSSRNVGVSGSFFLDVTWAGAYGGWMNCSGSIGIGAKTSYAVKYNANGGSGAPGNQTKWYGENLTLSSTKPTRTGYTFAGWATSASGAVAYQPGATYTGNAAVTLYAKWTAHTYTVSYNANGGSGAPGNQTKTYGVNLTLSSTKPTRTNYNFLGWGTSASATTVAYNPGATYTGNAALALYAIWKLAWKEPRITNLAAARCNSAGTLSEEGTYAKVTFNWATDKTISSIKIVCNGVTTNASGSGTSGSVSVVVGANALNVNNSYTIQVIVTDATGGVTHSTVVPPMNFIMDVAPNGSVAFGEPANPNAKEVKFSKNMSVALTGRVVGFSEQGYHNSTAYKYKLIAKSTADINNDDLSGSTRIVGIIGGYSPGSIDITIPNRGASLTNVHIDALTGTAFKTTACGILAVIDSANYLNIYIIAKNYYTYNIRLEGHGFKIVDAAWGNSRVQGTKILDTSEVKPDAFGGYPAKLEYSVSGYPGFTLPDKTRTEWIRTTSNGIIPYTSGGASGLGTSSWPFNNIYGNNIYANGSPVVTDRTMVIGSTTNTDSNNNTWYWDYIKYTKTKRCILFGKAGCKTQFTEMYGKARFNSKENCVYPFKVATRKSIQVNSIDVNGGLISGRPKSETASGCYFYLWDITEAVTLFTNYITVIVEGLYE